MAEKNIIIKRVKKGHHEAHGGAWKIAYADFVTALMAFFLLMWLLETMTNYERQGIAEYFNTSIAEAVKKGLSGKKTDATQSLGDSKPDKNLSPDLEEAKRQLEHIEAEQLRSLKDRIENEIESNVVLKQFQNQILVDITSEGLDIQIIDRQNRAMFAMSQAELMPYTKNILREIGRVLNGVSNRIRIAGHTDSTPFSAGMGGYSNWELSAERANTARRELILGGMSGDKVVQVVGLAEAVPLDKGNSLNPVNRRISIVILNNKTTDAILHGSDKEPRPITDIVPKGQKPNSGAETDKTAPPTVNPPKAAGAELPKQGESDKKNPAEPNKPE